MTRQLTKSRDFRQNYLYNFHLRTFCTVLFDDKHFVIGVTHTNGPTEVIAEVEHDLDAQDPPEAISLVEDVPMVETIGHIEDAQEVEAIGHIDDEVSLENNGVVEEPITGNTFSLKRPRKCSKMIFDF